MVVWQLETSPVVPGRLTRRRTELEEGDVILHELPLHVQNPIGVGAGARHGNSAPQDNRSYCRLVKELRLSLTGYCPSLFGNRRMRTRMYGGVEAGGEKPPAIRLALRFRRIAFSLSWMRFVASAKVSSPIFLRKLSTSTGFSIGNGKAVPFSSTSCCVP
jgi:hypothetical protein